MKKRWIYQIGMYVVAGVLLMSSACAPKAAPIAPALETELAPATEAALGTPAWQVKWDELIREAKKEGILTVYVSTSTSDERKALQQAMKDKFGVVLELISMKTQQSIARITSERRAGIFAADVVMSGANSLVTLMKPQGLIDPLHDVLFLPEVVDEKLWSGHKGVFYDRDHMIIAGFGTPGAEILVNTKLVKPGEIKNWEDLLHPKWKGNMVINDPTQPGGGSFSTWSTVLNLIGEDYLRKLAQQKPTITRDNRVQIEWVVKEKFFISVGISGSMLQEFISAGAGKLIKVVNPVEGVGVSTGGHNMVMVNRAPHPNAAKLFLNWTQTREGQTLMARLTGNGSRRLDVSNDWLDEYREVKPEVKYFHITEEVVLKTDEYLNLLKEIFGPLLK